MPVHLQRAVGLLALATGLCAPTAALAGQDTPSASAGGDTAAKDANVFTPDFFARFAPQTAYDMLSQVPGFTIRAADDTRGLGQASENVLINGQRVTDKSGGAAAQLQRISANEVLRIELREAASFGIAGLTGQVANVILKTNRKGSGNFSWSPQVRAHYAEPRWFAGSISYNGSTGGLDYTVSLENKPSRGALGGNDYRVLSPTGTLLERRDQVNWNSSDDAKLSAILKYTGKDGILANWTMDYDPYWQRGANDQRRIRTDGNDAMWISLNHTWGYRYDVNGDISVPLGGGRLKLIGLRHFEHAPFLLDQRTDYDSGAPSDGIRYGQDAKTSETVGRLEYHWKGGPNDWTISLERADNRFEQLSTLANLQPDGSYVSIPYPQGSGIVAETRYEGLATLSRSLSRNLDLQVAGGAEYSELGERSTGEKPRRFFRPKGSLLLAWRPARGWDASLKLERRVGQISFSDFLANQDVTNNRGNDANPNLVPPQSWEATAEVARNFGRWGKTRLKFYHYRIEDIVDHIPVGIDGDAVGNLPRATRTGIESISTIQFDPLGWKGAKLDADIGIERARVRDPLTGLPRVISNTHDRWAQLTLRHDVPGTQFAWGGGLSFDHYSPVYYLDEANQQWEGPYASAFVEFKNVRGMKVNFEVFNLNDGHVRYWRDVYSGRRNAAPLAFLERQHQRVGPIFTLTVSGTF
ncbi:TonB-dependent receptor plug domain-containing protein [Sphingomonas mali]|uniref:TonB-dependent receptor plug domain-containing protein n=1 Tax=Sphingomonas mali TaxID=40682 RepID=UPI000ACA632D|nr:TonB-dependent receptor plug domain-containing protein [Sphingomonas mali]